MKADNHKKLSERDLDRVELFLIENGFDGHKLTWDKIAQNFSFEVIRQTLHLQISKEGVYSFVAASKTTIDNRLASLYVT